MALRTYTDPKGNEWRVWPVTPSTGAGTLGVSYQGGWLCFERIDGKDRRRLSLTQVPPAWDALPDEDLEKLRRAAEPAGYRSGPARTDGTDASALEEEQRRRNSGPKTTIGGDDE